MLENLSFQKPSYLKGRYTRRILLQEHAQGHAPGANLLRVYQRFHGYSSSSGAEFPPRKMLHNIYPVKYFSGSKLPGQVERT